jgi:hypothetical protein
VAYFFFMSHYVLLLCVSHVSLLLYVPHVVSFTVHAYLLHVARLVVCSVVRVRLLPRLIMRSATHVPPLCASHLAPHVRLLCAHLLCAVVVHATRLATRSSTSRTGCTFSCATATHAARLAMRPPSSNTNHRKRIKLDIGREKNTMAKCSM